MQDDILINRPSKKHLELYDRDLKNFRISKALDRVLEVSKESVCDFFFFFKALLRAVLGSQHS